MSGSISESHPTGHGSCSDGLGVTDIDEVPLGVEDVVVVDVELSGGGSVVASHLIVSQSEPDGEWVLSCFRNTSVVGGVD